MADLQVVPLSQFAEMIAARIGAPSTGEAEFQNTESGGFVPLIGAGLSAASGIPVGPALHAYLKGCIYLALDENASWDPSKGKWPPVFQVWTEEKPEWFCECLKDPLREQESSSSSKWGEVGQKLIGALSTWEETLGFLARISRPLGKLTLGPSDGRVRDSLLAHLTGGRRPNSGHEMLAHLLDPLRVRTILTTNFDNLVEESLERLQSPVVVYDVHRHASLPPAELVLAQRSIVKLHGGRYGLRADDSLGHQPSAQDKDTLSSYFSFESGAKKDLLVLGMSGHDTRVMELLEHLCNKEKSGGESVGKVFWASYSQREIKELEERAKADYPELYEKLVITRHHDAGLLLLEIYQRACLSLPPASTGAQAFWEVPAEPYVREGQRHDARFEDYKTSLWEVIGTALREDQSGLAEETSQDPPKRIIAVDGRDGVASVAAEVYDALCDDSYCCVWMGMSNCYCKKDSFSARDSFFSSLAQAIARRTGVRYVTPLNLRTSANFKKELKYYLDRSRRPVVVFLNGGDGYGTCAGEHGTKWDDHQLAQFYQFLEEVGQPHLVFVLLFRTSKFKGCCGTPFPVTPRAAWTCVYQDRSCLKFGTPDVLRDVGEWLEKEGDDARGFLYALTLFRHSRYLAALCSRAQEPAQNRPGPRDMGEDRDLQRAAEVSTWLRDLEKMGAIRWKPGGLVWMHEEHRRALVNKLDTKYGMQKTSWECHQRIADWYAKLFRSLYDPLAALESVHHRIICADRVKYGELEAEQAARVKETALIEALAMLRLAKGRMLSCGLFETCDAFICTIRGMVEKFAGLTSSGATVPRLSAFSLRARELVVTCDMLRRDLAHEASDYDRALELSKTLRTEAQAEAKGSAVVPAGKTRSLIADIGEASFLTWHRAYDGAQSKLLSVVERGVSEDFRSMVRQTLRREVLDLHAVKLEIRGFPLDFDPSKQELLSWAVTGLRRLLFLDLLKAEAEHFAFAWRHRNGDEMGRGAKKHLQEAAVLYAIATEVMRSIEDEDFLQLEGIYLKMHYASVLSHLKRFSEAHRRLHEATGYLRCLAGSSERLSWSLIDLRRVEVYLAQANSKGEDVAAVVPLLNSAHIALEQAKRRLEIRTREFAWWTWMYELELGVCELTSRLGLCDSESAPEICRLCSHKRDGGRLAQIVRAEQRLIRTDVLRQARIVDLLSRFKHNRRRYNEEFHHADLLKEAKGLLGGILDMRSDQSPKLYGTIVKYAKAVLESPELA